MLSYYLYAPIHTCNKRYIIRCMLIQDWFTYPNENQLYFISVFIYTCIKVNLTKGEKEMASPKLGWTISADFFFWLQTNPKSSPKSKAIFALG